MNWIPLETRLQEKNKLGIEFCHHLLQRYKIKREVSEIAARDLKEIDCAVLRSCLKDKETNKLT